MALRRLGPSPFGALSVHQPPDLSEDDYENLAVHFQHTLPEEAMQMSHTGSALGYDIERYNLHPDYQEMLPVAQITNLGVQFLVKSEEEKRWQNEVSREPHRHIIRGQMIREWNFTPWVDLTPRNREFLLGLLWIPDDPLTAMEILAKAAE